MLRVIFRPVQRLGAGGVYNVLAVSAAFLVLLGWLLPWFITSFRTVGTSPMDVLVSPPAGLGSFLDYIMFVAMVVVVAGPVVDRLVRLRAAPAPAWLDPARGAISLVGLIAAFLLWLMVRWNADPSFGNIPAVPVTNSAVWMEWYGFGVAAVVYGLHALVEARPNTLFAATLLPFAALLPLMFHQAPDFVIWATQSLAIYTLLGLGLNVVVGFAGLLDLGYAAFFAIGGYTAGSLASPVHGVHLSLWLLIFICAAVAATFGAILGAPTLRLRGDYLAIVTLGFGEIIPDLAQNNVFGLTNGANGISGIDKPTIAGINFATNPQWFYWSLLLLMIIVVILLRNIYRSRLGRAWVALREDEVAAAATGINTTSTKLLAFAIGASVSGLAGAFYASIVSIVSPDDFSFAVSIAVLSIVVLGGIGNITGVVLGGFVLTFVIFWALPNINDWAGTLSTTFNLPSAISNISFSNYTYIVYGAALILMMLFRPGGFLPSRARKIELQSEGSESLAAVEGIA